MACLNQAPRHSGARPNCNAVPKKSAPVVQRSQAAKAKRGNFAMINSKLIAAADTRSLDTFLMTIRDELPNMNIVNMSTAMHRLTKFVSCNTATVRSSSVFDDLMTAIRDRLSRGGETDSAPQCQCLSNITWSLATLGHLDMCVVERMAELGHKHILKFKSFELSSLLWGLAKLGTMEPSVRSTIAPLFAVAADYISANVAQYSFRCLVMVSWAFATAEQQDHALFHVFADRMLQELHTASSSEMASVVWAFGSVGCAHQRLFQEISKRLLPNMTSLSTQDLVDLVSGFAAVGFFEEDVFLRVPDLCKRLTLHSQQLTAILCSMARLRPRHRATQTALLLMLPRCTSHLSAFKPQDLATVALAAAKCFGRTGRSLVQHSQAEALSSLPPPVSEFFCTSMRLIVPRLQHFSGQSFANIATAFLAVQIGGDTNLFTIVGQEAMRRADSFQTPDLLLLLRSLSCAPFSSCQIASRALFAEVAYRMPGLNMKDVETLSSICARCLSLPQSACLDRDALRACCATLATRAHQPVAVPTSPQPGVCDIGMLNSLGCVGATLKAASATTTSVASDLSVIGLGSESEDQDTQPADCDGVEASKPRRLPPPLDIKPQSISLETLNAYRVEYQQLRSTGKELMHVETVGRQLVPESRQASKDVDAELPSLPPPLDIIPKDVAAEKLKAYRMDYQRFRVGQCRGARGEVSSAVTADSEPLFICSDGLLSASQVAAAISAEGQQRGQATPSVASSSSNSLATWVGNRWAGVDTSKELSANNTFGRGLSDGGYDAPEFPFLLWRLPPPLSILPTDISAQKLESYRVDYQRFRAGDVRGAKGEIAVTTASHS